MNAPLGDRAEIGVRRMKATAAGSPTPVPAPLPKPGDVGLPAGTGEPLGVPTRRRRESVVAR